MFLGQGTANCSLVTSRSQPAIRFKKACCASHAFQEPSTLVHSEGATVPPERCYGGPPDGTLCWLTPAFDVELEGGVVPVCLAHRQPWRRWGYQAKCSFTNGGIFFHVFPSSSD